MRWFQDGQTVPDREAGSDDQDVFGESRILGMGDFVQDMPRDDHGHDDGLAEPVAILAHRRLKSPPSEGMSMPTLSVAGASVSQISVSAASIWQKKNRRASNSSGFVQCSNSRFVIPETPGCPASRHARTRGRMRLTNGISTNTPGSSNALEPSDATM